jgi:hypothetical protein
MRANVVCERPLLCDRRKAACMLSISVRSLDHLIAGEHIKFQKVGKRVLIHEKELTRFASSNHHFAVDSATNRKKPTAAASATNRKVSTDFVAIIAS